MEDFDPSTVIIIVAGAVVVLGVTIYCVRQYCYSSDNYNGYKQMAEPPNSSDEENPSSPALPAVNNCALPAVNDSEVDSASASNKSFVSSVQMAEEVYSNSEDNVQELILAAR